MSPDIAKTQSECFLREHGIAINHTLPFIESPSELSPQNAQSVATRAVVLTYVIGLGFDQTSRKMKASLDEWGLFDFASANEKRLLTAATITAHEKISCAWLAECVQGLGFCLGIASLDPFRHCDDNLASRFPVAYANPWDFITTASLRPFDEMYQQADLHYRLHWAVRDSLLTGSDCPVEESYITERRKAIDWVIGVSADWDCMPLDT